ncbi:hypothetical protein [Ureibacillus sp. FSL K6-0786]|uniref:hypothetical protein n=1 Tax=Ureibacillus sp. FSL K6-0786 TaxID=2954607 RepID=UPI0030DBCA20
MALLISLTILLFLGVIQAIVPYLVKRTVVFGVMIPEQHIKDDYVVSYKKTIFYIGLNFFFINDINVLLMDKSKKSF